MPASTYLPSRVRKVKLPRNVVVYAPKLLDFQPRPPVPWRARTDRESVCGAHATEDEDETGSRCG